MVLRNFLAIFTLCLIILIILMAWFLPLDEDFRVENPLWNGLKNLEDNQAIESIQSFAELPASPRGSTIIVIPYLEFTPEELTQLDRFSSEGGRIILADDYCLGNQLLEYLGTEVRFSGDVLVDPLANYKNLYLPKIIHFNPDPLTANLDSLGFNHATCLLNTDNSSVLALSSSFSFLDINDDGLFDDEEPFGPLPVIYKLNRNKGEIILVADPSLFINSMEKINDNKEFIQNIMDSTSKLYLDQSHLPPSDLHEAKDLIAIGREYLSEPVVAAGLIGVAVALTLKPIWYRKKEMPENKE